MDRMGFLSAGVGLASMLLPQIKETVIVDTPEIKRSKVGLQVSLQEEVSALRLVLYIDSANHAMSRHLREAQMQCPDYYVSYIDYGTPENNYSSKENMILRFTAEMIKVPVSRETLKSILNTAKSVYPEHHDYTKWKQSL